VRQIQINVVYFGFALGVWRLGDAAGVRTRGIDFLELAQQCVRLPVDMAAGTLVRLLVQLHALR